MGQSIRSLCLECSDHLERGHTDLSGNPITPKTIEISGYEGPTKRTPKDSYKSYILNKLFEMRKKGRENKGLSIIYNNAIEDIIDMIKKDF